MTCQRSWMNFVRVLYFAISSAEASPVFVVADGSTGTSAPRPADWAAPTSLGAEVGASPGAFAGSPDGVGPSPGAFGGSCGFAGPVGSGFGSPARRVFSASFSRSFARPASIASSATLTSIPTLIASIATWIAASRVAFCASTGSTSASSGVTPVWLAFSWSSCLSML
jgi:hypothetical protein